MLNPASLEIVRGARLEASLASAEVGSRWQLERVGYFVVDGDARPGAPVLNRIVTLRDSYAEIAAAREVLGWEPTIGFEDGLRRTADALLG